MTGSVLSFKAFIPWHNRLTDFNFQSKTRTARFSQEFVTEWIFVSVRDMWCVMRPTSWHRDKCDDGHSHPGQQLSCQLSQNSIRWFRVKNNLWSHSSEMGEIAPTGLRIVSSHRGRDRNHTGTTAVPLASVDIVCTTALDVPCCLLIQQWLHNN